MVSLNPFEGKTTFQKVSGKSGMITLLTKADGYIWVPSHDNCIEKGKDYDVILLD
jgi:molybdopterin biosynthesis enzyme